MRDDAQRHIDRLIMLYDITSNPAFLDQAVALKGWKIVVTDRNARGFSSGK